MYRRCKKSVFAYIVMGLAFVLTAFLGVGAVWIVLAAGLSGILYTLILTRRAKR